MISFTSPVFVSVSYELQKLFSAFGVVRNDLNTHRSLHCNVNNLGIKFGPLVTRITGDVLKLLLLSTISIHRFGHFTNY